MRKQLSFFAEADAARAKPLSVSEFIALLNSALREIEVQITGEITKVSFPPSGTFIFP